DTSRVASLLDSNVRGSDDSLETKSALCQSIVERGVTGTAFESSTEIEHGSPGGRGPFEPRRGSAPPAGFAIYHHRWR
ncbi:MAG TPA: hypothetical protein VF334_00595, partial [Polyangia bacterium]